MLDKNRVGLTFGLFLALIHTAWSIMVSVGWAQYLADIASTLHMVKMPHEVLMFDPLKAFLLVAVSFIIGYIDGWIFTAIYNKLAK